MDSFVARLDADLGRLRARSVFRNGLEGTHRVDVEKERDVTFREGLHPVFTLNPFRFLWSEDTKKDTVCSGRYGYV